MLSHSLIQLAEDHWERIAAAAMQPIREESELPHMAKLPDSELRDWARDILKSLQSWPGPNKDDKLLYHAARGYDAASGRVPSQGQ